MLLKKNNEVPVGTSFFLLLSDKTIVLINNITNNFTKDEN